MSQANSPGDLIRRTLMPVVATALCLIRFVPPEKRNHRHAFERLWSLALSSIAVRHPADLGEEKPLTCLYARYGGPKPAPSQNLSVLPDLSTTLGLASGLLNVRHGAEAVVVEKDDVNVFGRLEDVFLRLVTP